MRRGRILVVGTLVFVAVGVLEAPGASTQGSTERPVVDCGTRSQVIPPRDNPGRIRPSVSRRSVIAGGVVFLGAKLYSNYPEDSKPGIRIPVKTPMVVDAGAAVTISLATESQDEALISVARDQRPYEVRGTAVTLEPCPPDATVANRRVGRRTPFLGGFRLHGPTCVAVSVTTDDRPEPVSREVAFGAPCG